MEVSIQYPLGPFTTVLDLMEASLIPEPEPEPLGSFNGPIQAQAPLPGGKAIQFATSTTVKLKRSAAGIQPAFKTTYRRTKRTT